MTAPSVKASSGLLNQGTGTKNAPPIPTAPTALATGDLLIQFLGVGSNVQPSASPSFTSKFRSTLVAARPGTYYGYKYYTAGDTGDNTTTPGNSTYEMTTGASLAANSGLVIGITGSLASGDPFGVNQDFNAASGANTVSGSYSEGNYLEESLVFAVLTLSAPRITSDPAGWTRVSTPSVASTLHVFSKVAPAPGSGAIAFPSLTMSSGGTTAQSRLDITSIKKPAAAGSIAYPDVMVGGTAKTVTGMSVIIGGVAKPVTSLGVVVGGVLKPLS